MIFWGFKISALLKIYLLDFCEILRDVYYLGFLRIFGFFKKMFIIALIGVFWPVNLHEDFLWENFLGKCFLPLLTPATSPEVGISRQNVLVFSFNLLAALL